MSVVLANAALLVRNQLQGGAVAIGHINWLPRLEDSSLLATDSAQRRTQDSSY